MAQYHRETPASAAAFNLGHDDCTKGRGFHPAFGSDGVKESRYRDGYEAAQAGSPKLPQLGQPEDPKASQFPRR